MECFTGSHAALATFAILMLIVLVLLIIALLTVVLGKVKVCNVIILYVCFYVFYHS